MYYRSSKPTGRGCWEKVTELNQTSADSRPCLTPGFSMRVVFTKQSCLRGGRWGGQWKAQWGTSERTGYWWEVETNTWQILDQSLEPKGLPQAQSLRIWMPEDLSEPSEIALKELVSTNMKTTAPSCSWGHCILTAAVENCCWIPFPHVSLKAFQRGSEKAGCTLVNWKLFVTNHPSPSLNIHHQKKGGGHGARRPDPSQGGCSYSQLPLSFWAILE